MGKFVISKRSNGHYQFTLKTTSGKVILTSQGYTLLTACENGIDAVRRNCNLLKRYDLKSTDENHFYFNLKAANGQVIGTSETYSSALSRDNGVATVMGVASIAAIEFIEQ
jgi:uncharacterized protein